MNDTHYTYKSTKLQTLKCPNFCIAISFLSIKVVICWFLKTKHTLCHSLGDQLGNIFAPLEVKEYAMVAPSSSFKLLRTILWVLWNHDVSASLLIATEARISLSYHPKTKISQILIWFTCWSNWNNICTPATKACVKNLPHIVISSNSKTRY